jgi:flagellar FliL protein
MQKEVTNSPVVPEKKRSLWKMLLLVINILLFLSGVAFFMITKFAMFQNANTTDVLAQGEYKQEAKEVKEPGKLSSPKEPAQTREQKQDVPLVKVPLPSLTVNLSGNGGRNYLRLSLQVMVQEEGIKTLITERAAEIQHHLLFLLSSKSFADISTIQGKYQLQEEIARILNEVVGKPIVEKIYFTEFIVQ